MPYAPQYTITAQLLDRAEAIAVLRERILRATVELSWIPALQQDARTRNVHASTAIDGNPLTLAQVRALEEGQELTAADPRSRRKVLNYLAGLRYIEQQAEPSPLRHNDIFDLHRIVAGDVMDQGQAGRYRTISVRVRNHISPGPEEVSGLMLELLEWWNRAARELSPVLSSAILHYQFESIHPFADGNGRTGRAMALWDLYRRGFDTHHIFSIDEYYWENRPRYYEALDTVRGDGDDMTPWLEFCAEGLCQTLERVWLRVRSYHAISPEKLVLRPRQEKLLKLLSDHGSMSPAEIWSVLSISRQGAMDLLRPLLKSGLVEKHGSKKTGRYTLRRP